MDRGLAYCPESHHINEDKLIAAYSRALHKVAEGMDEYLQVIQESCDMVMKPALQQEMDALEQRIIEIQEAVLALHKEKQRGLITPSDFAKRTSEYKEELTRLQEQQKEMASKRGNTVAIEYWLKNFREATEQTDAAAIEPTVIKTLVDKIIVHGRDSIDIHFKCGVVITEEL